MSKKTIKNESKSKKFLKITLWIILGIIGIFALFIIGSIALSPVFSKIEHDRFIALDKQMQIVYKNLKTASNGVDDWKYDKVCEDQLAGDWPTGRYLCKATISLDRTVSSVDELNSLQAKYFTSIDDDAIFEDVSELKLYLPNDFGKRFVVSSASKEYKNIDTNIKCGYSIDLYQNDNLYGDQYAYESYGMDILGNVGRLGIRLKCSESSGEHWYFYKE